MKTTLLAALTLVTAAVACSKSSKPWPDKPLVETTAKIGPHTVKLLLPEGVGKYDDPNGKIWRYVSTDYAFFVKVFASERPDNLESAIEDLSLEPNQKILTRKETAELLEIVVEEPGNKRHTVRMWKTKSGRTVSCLGLLGESIGNAEMVAKSNAWIHKMCASLAIQ